jgi:cysteine desulfurase
MAIKTPVYLDYQATTPLDERVLDAMMPYLTTHFGNPHSSTHSFGWQAEAALDMAREDVAALIGAQPSEIFFTSGATEANNMVIKGVMAELGHKRPRMITVATEHKCVLEAAKACAAAGYELEVLPVGPDGLLDLNRLEDALDETVALVSVMGVNNEIGVVQPQLEIGALARKVGALFHSDVAQMFGKLPIDVNEIAVDFLSISGHKIYGPKGVGALFRRQATQQFQQYVLMSGGGQEMGVRSGTQAPALVAGLGTAARLAGEEMAVEAERTKALINKQKSRLFDALPGLVLNGDGEKRWAGNLNLSFPGIDGDLLISTIRTLAVSSGAACASAVSGPSYVLEAIGRTREEAQSSLRIGMGRFTTGDELDYAADTLITAVQNLGGLKP